MDEQHMRASAQELAVDAGPEATSQCLVQGHAVDAAVDELNRIAVRKGLETARAVADFVLGLYYNGDIRAYRAHWHPGHASLQELASHPRLQVSGSFIAQAIAVVDQMRRMPAELAEALSFSHHRELLVLTDERAREELAKEAVREGLNRDQLKARVDRIVASSSAVRRGRPRQPGFAQIRRCVEQAVACLDAELLTAEEFSRFTWTRSQQVLDESIVEVRLLEDRLVRARALLDTLVEADLAADEANQAR